MNNNTRVRKIQTYDDLVEEKKRLEQLLTIQKEQISANWIEIKEEFKPVNNIISFFSKLTTRDKSNPLVNMGIDVAGDLLLRKILLAKMGWATRIVVPFLLKNYSSNVFADKGKALIQKVKHWMKSNKNGKSQPKYSNDTETDRAKNRRVEFAIYASEELIKEAKQQAVSKG